MSQNNNPLDESRCCAKISVQLQNLELTMLHIISNPNFKDYQVYINSDDCLLFIADGIYNLVNNEAYEHTVYVLENDAKARGIAEKITASFRFINYDEFVALTIKYEKIMSW